MTAADFRAMVDHEPPTTAELAEALEHMRATIRRLRAAK
jgi:CHAD domain-containing protein